MYEAFANFLTPIFIVNQYLARNERKQILSKVHRNNLSTLVINSRTWRQPPLDELLCRKVTDAVDKTALSESDGKSEVSSTLRRKTRGLVMAMMNH